MSRVITFSTRFPSYHPRKGEQTHFVEKIWNSLPNHYDLDKLNPGKKKEVELFWQALQMNYRMFGPKLHTIRAGHRWKAGDKFSPRVWSGKPYHSKQIIIAPDMEVKKVWEFEIIDGSPYLFGVKVPQTDAFRFVGKLAANDGLSFEDFLAWFKYQQPFQGQVICWDENVNY